MSIKDDYFKWYRENYQKLKPTEKAEADKEVSNWKWHDKLEEIILNDPKYDKEKWKYALDHMYWRDAWLALADDDEIVAADREVYEYLTKIQGKGEEFKVEYNNPTDDGKFKNYNSILDLYLDVIKEKPNTKKCMKIKRYFYLPDKSYVTISTMSVDLLAWTSQITEGIGQKVRFICDEQIGKIDYAEIKALEEDRYDGGVSVITSDLISSKRVAKCKADRINKIRSGKYIEKDGRLVLNPAAFDIMSTPYKQGNPWI